MSRRCSSTLRSDLHAHLSEPASAAGPPLPAARVGPVGHHVLDFAVCPVAGAVIAALLGRKDRADEVEVRRRHSYSRISNASTAWSWSRKYSASITRPSR